MTKTCRHGRLVGERCRECGVELDALWNDGDGIGFDENFEIVFRRRMTKAVDELYAIIDEEEDDGDETA